MPSLRVRRGLAAGALVAVIAALVLVLTSSHTQKLSAQFVDASQLVKGSPVQIAGQKVGTVEHIGLSPNGQARVDMKVQDDLDLHRGTRAEIRSLGLSGVANRFVELTPGPPSTPKIADGGDLTTDYTRGVVDFDALLDSLDGPTRRDIQRIFAQVAAANSPRVARQFNAGIHLANPAISQLTLLGRELTSDEVALRALIQHSSSVVGAVARQRDALGSSIDSSANVLSAVASQRDQLAAGLQSAPAALQMTTRTMHRVRTRTLPLARSVVTAAEPGIKPLGSLLKITTPTLSNALPVVRRTRALLPAARSALRPLPRLQRAASPAVTSTSKALRDALPMITGLRGYTPDLVGGFFTGFGGAEAHAYDANGHYLRISFQLGPGSGSGLIPKPPSSELGGLRTGLDARCPGGAEEAAPDRSNPFLGVPGTCDPKDDHR